MKKRTIHYPLIEQEAKKAFENAPPTHDFSHTQRVLNLCMHIGEEEGADTQILYAAALLHDIGREQGDANGLCHAEVSAKMARPILEKAGFPPEKIEPVIHCIATHRFRGDAIPFSLEAKILFDCDKLDAIGAIGICRAYAYCGENGQRLYSFACTEETPGANEKISKITDHSRHTPLIEFRLKLSKIKDRLFTPSARNMAQIRHAYMSEFFQRLFREVKGSDRF